ncbi:MAG: GNAT family N-acetyltransferase [Rhodobiaceae bacterium]|nr:GNAT family N-acetyltransferase [Rhodobiaceae bacterium]MCC0014398.1 GNAT family N-acetyltransferase [Rhodobiaceae bacterium]MCC0050968.1 GNAT family N-acetyltransferase [Rhodobiaceae bacterium]MCC0060328.1 GNAT family N-acetyltransferase [Rhodobiaceae bacterium]
MTSPIPPLPRQRPPRTALEGRTCRVEPVTPEHFAGLWDAYIADAQGRIWDYLPYGPFASRDDFMTFAGATYLGEDPLFHAIIDTATGKVAGVASLMRIVPEHGVIEVGHINYAPALQKTPAGTEAQYLLMKRVFDELGYRRYEWKCDNANEGSKAAALRYGFHFEGIFRNHLVVKGRNRDTAWFSIIDSEWPAVRAAFERWLDPDNFDAAGRQKTPLAANASRQQQQQQQQQQ